MSPRPNLQASNDATQRRLAEVAVRLGGEYDGVFSRETVEAVVDDSVRRLLPITVTTHVPVLVERFARERLQAAAHADGLLASPRPRVLFVCAHNAARSQMAAALTRRSSEGRVAVMSAGTDPLPEIDANVIAACPVHPGPRYLDWLVDDPAGQDLDTVRSIRYAISNHVDLLEELL